MTEDITTWIALLAIILIILMSLELAFLAYLFLTADRVECNWIFCNFIQERTKTETRTEHKCYMNNIEVNCSELK
jgi:uncharacterized protein involved in cysteine biosynthesis